MKPLRPLIAAILVLAALPSSALASKTQESTFQDDPLLVYGTAEQQISTLDTLKGFGVDRIRVSVFWKLLAQANEEVQKPNLDTTDPTSYQSKVWEKYDTLIREAQARGILVNLNFTSPVPRWASTDSPRADLQQTFNPNPEEFGKFVRAVGTRYSGTYNGLPRVDFWSIWNEPNQAGWLTPQWSPDPRNASSQIDAAPAIYRNLVANAWQGLADTGHGSDTILVGETAPQGQGKKKGIADSIDALKFVRRLYCVDNNLNVLKGAQASLRQCPGDTASFVAANPGLFHASGYAHHPYALLSPPGRKSRFPDWVSMADLPALSRELTRIYQRYGQKTQSRRGVPLYLTEYGYQTRPDPITHVSFNQQAAYINQAEYMAYRNPNVRAVNQFLLVDDGTVEGVDPKKNPSLAYRTFQSGLQLLAGKRKPSYKAYLTPIVVKQQRVRRGGSTGVFGALRPAEAGIAVRARIQFRSKTSKKWKTRKTITVGGPRHYFETRVTVPATGYLRIVWANARTHADQPRRERHRDALTPRGSACAEHRLRAGAVDELGRQATRAAHLAHADEQLLVLVGDRVPRVAPGALAGPGAVVLDELGLVEEALELGGQRRHALLAGERQAGVADRLDVRRVIVDEHAVAGGERLEDDRVRAAHLGRRAEDVGVALQLPVAAAEDVAGEDDARVAGALDLLDVVVGVGRAADDDELHPPRPLARDAAERLDEHVGVVLGLQAADEQDVAARLQPEAVERLGALVAGVLDAVRHDADALAVALLEDLGDRVRVGDRGVRPARRVALGEAQVGLGERRPLRAVGVQPVDVDHRRDAGAARDEAHRAVAGDEEQRDVGPQPPRAVQRGQERVRERVEVLVAHRRDVHQPGALVLLQPAVDDVRTAVDDDLVAALGEAAGELLGRRLETAVGGRDAARPQDRDLHRAPPVVDSLARACMLTASV